MSDSVNVALDSSVSMARWLWLKAEWDWPLNLQLLSCDKMLTQWTSTPPWVSLSLALSLPSSPSLSLSLSKVQPRVLSTCFESQQIKSHIINTPLLTSVLLCVCVCVYTCKKYSRQSWRNAHCSLPKALSSESTLCLHVQTRSQKPVNTFSSRVLQFE